MKRSIYSIILFLEFFVCFGLSLFPQNEDTQLLKKFIQNYNIQVDSIDKSEEILRKIEKEFNFNFFSKYANTAFFDLNKNLIGLIIISLENSLDDLDLGEFNNLEILVLNECHIESVNSIHFPTSLKALDLGRNTLKAITLRSLDNLEKLNLNSCGLKTLNSSSQLPPKLTHLNLKQNDLYFNKHEKYPESTDLSNLDNLHELDLSGCKLENLTSSQLPEKLIELNLNNNLSFRNVNLTDLNEIQKINLIDCNFKNLNSLQLPKLLIYIDLSRSINLTRVNLQDLSNLSSLILKNCSITNLNSSQLPDSLESLNLMDNKKLKTLELSELKHLKKLNLENCALNNLRIIKLPESLTELILKANTLNEMKVFEKLNLLPLKNLKKLNLSFCDINNAVIEDIELPNDLKEIDLSHNEELTKFTLDDKYEKLEKLVLTNCNLKLIDFSKIPKLAELNLKYNKKLNIKGIESLKNLRVLNLTDSNIKNSDLSRIEKISSLNKLILNQNEGLNDSFHLSGLRSLKELQLSNCSIKQLDVENFPKITTIDVKKNEKLNKINFIEKHNVSRLELTLNGKDLVVFPAKSTILEIKSIEFLRNGVLKSISFFTEKGKYKDCLLKWSDGNIFGQFAKVEIKDIDREPIHVGREANLLNVNPYKKFFNENLKWILPLFLPILSFVLGLILICHYPKIHEFLNLSGWAKPFASSIKLSIFFLKPLRRKLLSPFTEELSYFIDKWCEKDKCKKDLMNTYINSLFVTEITNGEKKEKVKITESIKKIEGTNILRGKPGTGKTTFIKYMISNLYNANKKKEKPIPVYLPASHCRQGVLNAIRERLENSLIQKDKEIKALINNKTLILFIDGLNTHEDEIVIKISKFLTSCRKGNILVSTRLEDWTHPRAKLYELTP